jgi:hypothetical protein
MVSKKYLCDYLIASLWFAKLGSGVVRFEKRGGRAGTRRSFSSLLNFLSSPSVNFDSRNTSLPTFGCTVLQDLSAPADF